MTTLVVTQKIHTAQTADRILLIDEGKIHGFGTHDELLQQTSLYQKLSLLNRRCLHDENFQL